MDLQELQRHWDHFGRDDPFWAILTRGDKRGGRWTPEEFFREGDREIEIVLGMAEALGVPPARQRALDFGCGAGRLTQALAARFARCDGVDIAPSMIELARRYNRFPERCRYHVSATGDLGLFEDGAFSFVYCVLVLQHMRPDYAERYLQEFARVLAPGGLLVFQALSEPAPEPAAVFGWRTPSAGPLGRLGFRARILPERVPAAVRPGERFRVRTTVQNAGAELWPALPAGAARGEVALGNHWLAPDGTVLTLDDARAPLPRDLAPRDDVDVVIEPRAPFEPGEYVLELDMVQEGVAWFRYQGSPGVLVNVAVSEAAAPAAEVEAAEAARPLTPPSAPPGASPDAEPAAAEPAPRPPGPARAAWRRLRALAREALAPPPPPPAPEPAFEHVMEMNCLPRERVFQLVADAGARVVELERHCMPGFRSYRYWVLR